VSVTVCIPAYRAGRFLAATLKSVAEQTFAGWRAEIAVDPADCDGTGSPEDTLAALAPFLDDGRFRLHRNPSRLGWDGNIRALLERVETPYYAILPHDDIWDPRYLETFLGALERHPAASVAYGDLYAFGATDPWRHAVQLPATADTRTQLLAFMLQGAEAMPWRGVTRSALRLSVGGFPADGHRGFAVECEYALALILAGPAVHLPRTLYYKRIHPQGVMTASRARVVEPARDELERAWRGHADRMRQLVEKGLAGLGRDSTGSTSMERMIRAALAAAMLRRYPGAGVLRSADADEARAWLTRLAAEDAAVASPVVARLHWVLWRDAVARGDRAQSRTHAEAAHAANPGDWEACQALALDLEARGRWLEALDLVGQAECVFPGGAGLAAQRRRLYGGLGWSEPVPRRG